MDKKVARTRGSNGEWKGEENNGIMRWAAKIKGYLNSSKETYYAS